MNSPLLNSFPVVQPTAKSRWATQRLPWLSVLTGLGLWSLFVIILAAIQFSSPDLAGTDGYYHIKLAQVMRLQGLRPAFPWLPLTILNAADFYDHHFLYHVLLMPFTFSDLRLGAKWAGVLFPAFSFMMAWVLLRGQKVPYAALWTLGLAAVSEAFLYRMSMPRVQSVSLMMLLLTLHVMLTNRHRWLLPISFLYVWLYDAFPLVLMVAVAYVALSWLTDRRFNPMPLVFAGAGIALGLLVNPYFPDNLTFIYHHLAPKLADATAIKVGNEWYPYQTWTLAENSGLALLAFVGGTFALGFSTRRMSTATGVLLALSVLFGVMLFKSRRFVEYYPAFALLFCAFAWTPLLKEWAQPKTWLRYALPVLLAAIIVPAIGWNIQATGKSMQRSEPYQRYADASAWLEQNTPAGSRVFQTDWDDFTRLFFYNTHNTYTVGLDPTYLQLYDANLYTLWVDITQGKVNTPAQVIKQTFGASYIFTDLKHKDFMQKATTDPEIKEVYRDDYAVIFRVIEPK